MQTKTFLAKVFGHFGEFEGVQDRDTIYIFEGDFLGKTWGNDHYQVRNYNGRKALAVSKDNLKNLVESSRPYSANLNKLFLKIYSKIFIILVKITKTSFLFINYNLSRINHHQLLHNKLLSSLSLTRIINHSDF